MEFWEMTPRETYMAIEASIWREEYRQKQDAAQAWRIAMLIRAKKLPSLQQLLNPRPANPLRGKELDERRREFRAMTKNLDVNKLIASNKQRET